jgi:hypothetical protein
MILKGLVFFSGFFVVVAAIFTLICRDARHFTGISAATDANLGRAFFDRLYFTVTTFTTIGLGDVTPASIRARSVVMVIALVFLVVILKSLDNIRTTVTAAVPITKHAADHVLHPHREANDQHEAQEGEEVHEQK